MASTELPAWDEEDEPCGIEWRRMKRCEKMERDKKAKAKAEVMFYRIAKESNKVSVSSVVTAVTAVPVPAVSVADEVANPKRKGKLKMQEKRGRVTPGW